MNTEIESKISYTMFFGVLCINGGFVSCTLDIRALISILALGVYGIALHVLVFVPLFCGIGLYHYSTYEKDKILNP